MVNFTINGKSLQAPEGTTILTAAESAGITIPHLCYFPGINDIGACRLCVVEIDGFERLAPACNTQVAEGMVIRTESPRVRSARKVNLQLILSRHRTACTSCIRNGNCVLQTLSRQFNIQDIPYDVKPSKAPADSLSPIVKDASKCIHCMRCVQVCDVIQNQSIWQMTGSASRSTVDTLNRKPLTDTECTFCGQCVTHCPCGALTERDDTQKVLDMIADPELVTIIQVAPAVRAAWSESAGLTAEEASVGKMVAALKNLGFKFVFDTNFAADLTIMEEVNELVSRFKAKTSDNWPMFTSCCPGWVRFLKNKYPEMTSHLSTAKSPQQMFGSIAKTYFAKCKGIDPLKIRVVSVMPCTAKKAECELPTMKDDYGKDVDAVLTTREFCRMLAMLNVNPRCLKDETFDSLMGESTGAAVIFGASGGVMDAALRTLYYIAAGQDGDPDAFADIRPASSEKRWQEGTLVLPNLGEVKVATVSGLANTTALMEAIKNGSAKLDFVEVMACPGGCAGGGGQPIQEGTELAGERGTLLWNNDKSQSIRRSHQNSEIHKLYEDFIGLPNSETAHRYLHTDHSAWDSTQN